MPTATSKQSADTAHVPARRWAYIIPVATVMYVLAFVDRINVGMILPYIDKNFGLTSADSGFAAGVFFFGYSILPIPCSLLAERWSARKIVTILMVLWGITAVLTGFVQNRMELYIARFVLGLFEGGVWPSILVLLSNWFPQRERARANALWITCLPLAAVIMAPVTGWLLTLLNWRWVFVIEGIPVLLWSGLWWWFAADHPKDAAWAPREEKQYIEQKIAAETENQPPASGYWNAFTDRTVLLLVATYFFWMAGLYGYTIWVPTVVKSLTHGSSAIVGLLTAIPFAFALVAMVVTSFWSDRVMKRQVFVAVPVLIGAIGLIGGQFMHSPVTQFIFLIISAIGVYAAFGPFWTVPTTILRPEMAAAALGLVNLGNLGGFVGPYVVGYLHKATGSQFAGFIVLGVFLLIAACISLLLKSDARTAESAKGRADNVPHHAAPGMRG